ncbi:hypothetical protein [Citreimonas sp.]|uniref:hypothetical protein n=1 Tax=Citreimonas sp. TaxID=3036715 RepID=UPI0035C85A48
MAIAVVHVKAPCRSSRVACAGKRPHFGSAGAARNCFVPRAGLTSAATKTVEAPPRMTSPETPTIFKSLQRAIEAHVYRQIVRDRLNRLRYGAGAPLSAMAIYPRPRAITHSYARTKGMPRLGRQQSGMVRGGDWDQSRSDISKSTKLVSCRMRWIDGADWHETPIVRQMVEQIGRGLAPDGCRSREDVLARYRRLDRIFEETRARGRLLDMDELPDFHYRRAHGATLVHIARDGTCLRSGGGAHRFAIAHILDLPEMPAQLGVIHPEALKAGHLDRLRKSTLRLQAPKPGRLS